MPVSRFVAALAVFLYFNQAVAQTFDNLRTRIEDDRVIIFYDLLTTETRLKVNVRVFYTQNNIEKPLDNATGAIGLVNPGPNRRIVWQAGALVPMINQITFRLEGEIIYYLQILQPQPGENLTRGKTYPINWRGGNPDNPITIALIAPGQDSLLVARTSNTGSYTWKIPDSLSVGKTYTLKLAETGGEVVEQRFTVKRKIPLATWGIPVLGIITFIIINGSGEGGDQPLPDAPKPG